VEVWIPDQVGNDKREGETSGLLFHSLTLGLSIILRALWASAINSLTVTRVYLWSAILSRYCGGTVIICAPAKAALITSPCGADAADNQFALEIPVVQPGYGVGDNFGGIAAFIIDAAGKEADIGRPGLGRDSTVQKT